MNHRNSPAGQNQDEFSSFHMNSPNSGVLQKYFEGGDGNAIQSTHPFFRDLIKDVKDKVVLDIGCGLGSVFCQGLLYYGLDPNNLYSLDPDHKNFERDEYHRVNKIISFAEKTELNSNFFDVVHSNEMTLDNITIDYVQVLKEVNRVLKSGGVYVANEHFDQVSEMRNKDERVKETSKDLLKIVNNEKLLDELGFKPIVKVKYVDSPKINPNYFIFYLFEKK